MFAIKDPVLFCLLFHFWPMEDPISIMYSMILFISVLLTNQCCKKLTGLNGQIRPTVDCFTCRLASYHFNHWADYHFKLSDCVKPLSIQLHNIRI